MVLGLTGAWFTKSANSGAAETNTLAFGKVGAVAIQATGVKHYDSDGNELKEGTAREVMPGDKVLAGGVKFSYDKTEAEGVTETTVWYLIEDQGGHQYVSNGTVLVELSAKTAAGYLAAASNATISNGAENEVTIAGQELLIRINNVWYSLDGSSDGSATEGHDGSAWNKAKESWQIGEIISGANTASYSEGKSLSDASFATQVGAVVYNAAGTRYKMAVVQTTNLDDAEVAYAALVAELALINIAA